MTIAVAPISKLFNLLSPGRVHKLNNEMWATASTVHGAIGQDELWLKMIQLLRAGADINAINGNGDTALNLLCDQGHSMTAIRFLQHGAALGPANKNGMTPFLTAARSGDPLLLKEFVARGVNLEERTMQNENAINILLGFVPMRLKNVANHAQTRCEALRVLLAAGMKLDKSSSMRIYHHENGYLPAVPEIVKVRELKAAIESSAPWDAYKIIAKGVHPDATAEFGDQSALAFAAGVGDEPLLDACLKAGANINLTSGDQHATAMQMAVLRGMRNTFVKLLDAGANPEQLSVRFGENPLFHAAQECKDETMWKFVSDTMHDRAKDKLALQSDVSVKPLRLKLKDPGSA